MRRPVKVLFAEPPAERRVGGIDTALSGLAAAFPAAEIELTRSADLTSGLVESADVVHFHGLWEPLHHRARNWCRRAGKPYIVSPHGMLEDWAFRHRSWKKRPYFHLIERRSVARANIVLATSDQEAIGLRRWFPREKVQVLPLGATAVSSPDHGESRRKLGFAADEFVILFLSRCHEKKGLHLLVQALPEVACASATKLHLVVVGDGEAGYVTPLRRATESWQGNLRCTWAGAIWGPEKWNYLSAADLLCLPSFSENFGLVILEALFAGVPVLTTYATPWSSLRGSLPVRLINPDKVELVGALRDQALSPALDPTARAQTKLAALAAFDWTILAPQYVAMYRRLADPVASHAD